MRAGKRFQWSRCRRTNQYFKTILKHAFGEAAELIETLDQSLRRTSPAHWPLDRRAEGAPHNCSPIYSPFQRVLHFHRTPAEVRGFLETKKQAHRRAHAGAGCRLSSASARARERIGTVALARVASVVRGRPHVRPERRHDGERELSAPRPKKTPLHLIRSLSPHARARSLERLGRSNAECGGQRRTSARA